MYICINIHDKKDYGRDRKRAYKKFSIITIWVVWIWCWISLSSYVFSLLGNETYNVYKKRSFYFI